MKRGPTNPEAFRTYDQWNRRFYHDPLPGDDIAQATTDQYPSVSTIKKAWSKEFRKKLATGETVPLDAYRAASFAVDHLDQIAGLPADAAVSMICSQPRRDLNRAAERGTSVHDALEAFAEGRTPDTLLNPDAEPFIPGVQAFIKDHAPQFQWSEVVCISRTHGYAGTFDAGIVLDGKLLLADYKTRGGKHGCYEEEVAQVSAYAYADYYIVQGPGGPVRVEPPKWDGGLIVSLTSDGYELFPIDLEHGFDGFKAMRLCWGETRDGKAACRRAIGKPLLKFSGAGAPSGAPGTADSQSSADGTPTTAPEPIEQYQIGPARPDRRQWIAGRVRAIAEHPDAMQTLLRAWPDGVEGFKSGHEHTDPEVVAIAKACAEAERAHGLPFFSQRDPVEVDATTGIRPDDPQIIELTDRLRTLPPDLLADVETQAVGTHGIPRMSSGRCTRPQLDQIDQLVGAACTAAGDRRGMVKAHLAVLEEKVPRALHGAVLSAVTRGRHDEPDRLTAWEAERLGEIVDAVGLGLLEVNGDGFAAHTDMTRGDLLAAGKATADELGIDRPKSSADVLGDPVLFAAVAAGATNTTAQQRDSERKTA